MAKILIVDDDPVLVKDMRLFLEDDGYEVVSAPSGEEGLRKARQEKPDLVILDVMMPGMDGFEVSRAIRKDPNIPEIPILMLTAIKDKMGLDFKKEAGDKDWLPVSDYCDKPIAPEAVLNKVEKLLHQSRKSEVPTS